MSMRSLPIHRPTLDDPLYSQKNAYQTFLLLLSILSSLPLLQGHANSAALDRELDNTTLLLWGACLLGGSVFALLGEFWRGHTWNGLVIERFGVGIVGLAALIYSWVVWRHAGDRADVAFVAAITSAYGLACVWRFGQITRRLRWIKAMKQELDEIRAGRQVEDGAAP